MVANDNRHRAIGPNHVEYLASRAIPILFHTSRPFGLSSLDGVKAMVNVSVR
jgi:hypothetical protein